MGIYYLRDLREHSPSDRDRTVVDLDYDVMVSNQIQVTRRLRVPRWIYILRC